MWLEEWPRKLGETLALALVVGSLTVITWAVGTSAWTGYAGSMTGVLLWYVWRD